MDIFLLEMDTTSCLVYYGNTVKSCESALGSPVILQCVGVKTQTHVSSIHITIYLFTEEHMLCPQPLISQHLGQERWCVCVYLCGYVCVCEVNYSCFGNSVSLHAYCNWLLGPHILSVSCFFLFLYLQFVVLRHLSFHGEVKTNFVRVLTRPLYQL